VSAVQNHPRSLMLVVGTNQLTARICYFLLVRNSNLGPMLHRFGDFAAFMYSWWPHPYSTIISGVFPLHYIAFVGVNVIIIISLFVPQSKATITSQYNCSRVETGMTRLIALIVAQYANNIYNITQVKEIVKLNRRWNERGWTTYKNKEVKYRLRKRDKFTLLIVRLNATKVLKSTVVGKPFQAFMTRSLKKELRLPMVWARTLSEIILEVFQPMWSRYLNVTDIRTDGQTTCNLITALWVVSRGKNYR